MLNEAQVEVLLSELCIELGFCLPPNARELLRRSPPTTVKEFTDSVFRAEGLDPEIADRGLYRQVRDLIAPTFAVPEQ